MSDLAGFVICLFWVGGAAAFHNAGAEWYEAAFWPYYVGIEMMSPYAEMMTTKGDTP